MSQGGEKRKISNPESQKIIPLRKKRAKKKRFPDWEVAFKPRSLGL